MNDDVRSLLRGLGCLPAVLGAIVMGLGAFYAAMQWRYGGAILVWSLMWGLMLSGVGLALMSTGRRWMAACATVACGVSALLVYLWKRDASLDGWSKWIYSGDAFGGVIGIVAIISSFWKRSRETRSSQQASKPSSE